MYEDYGSKSYGDSVYRKNIYSSGDRGYASFYASEPDRRALETTAIAMQSNEVPVVLEALSFFRDCLMKPYNIPKYPDEFSSISNVLIEIIESRWDNDLCNFQAGCVLLDLLRYTRTTFLIQDSILLRNSVDQSKNQSNEYKWYSSRKYDDKLEISNSLIKLLQTIIRILCFRSPENKMVWIIFLEITQTLSTVFDCSCDNQEDLERILHELVLDICHSSSAQSSSSSLPSSCIRGVYNILVSYMKNENLKDHHQLPEDIIRGCQDLLENAKTHPKITSDFMSLLGISGHQFEKKLEQQEREYSSCTQSVLYSMQNATNHESASVPLIDLMEQSLSTNCQLTLAHLSTNGVQGNHAEWKKTFTRYLTLTPQNPDDESLLIKVLSLLDTFVMKNETEWFGPLCCVKDSSLLRLMKRLVLAPIDENVAPSSLLKQLMKFFEALALSSISLIEWKWDVFLFLQTALRNVNKASSIHHELMICKAISSYMKTSTVQLSLKAIEGALFDLIEELKYTVQNILERLSVNADRYISLESLRLALDCKISCIKYLVEGDKQPQWLIKMDTVMVDLFEIDDPCIKSKCFQMCVPMVRALKNIHDCDEYGTMETLLYWWDTASKSFCNDYSSCDAPFVAYEAAVLMEQLLIAFTAIQLDEAKHMAVSFEDLRLHTVIESVKNLIPMTVWEERHSKVFPGKEKTEEDSYTIADEKGDYRKEKTQPVVPVQLSDACCRLALNILEWREGSDIEEEVQQLAQMILQFLSNGAAFLKIYLEDNEKPSEVMLESFSSALNSAIYFLTAVSFDNPQITATIPTNSNCLLSCLKLFSLEFQTNDNSKETGVESITVVWMNLLSFLSLCLIDGYDTCTQELIYVFSEEWNFLYQYIIRNLNNNISSKDFLLFSNLLLNIFKLEEQGMKIQLPVFIDDSEAVQLATILSTHYVSIQESSELDQDRLLVLGNLILLNELHHTSEHISDHLEFLQAIYKILNHQHQHSSLKGSGRSEKERRGFIQKKNKEYCAIISFLSSLVYKCKKGKEVLLRTGMLATVHKLFRIFENRMAPGGSYLLKEFLVNFTEDFSEGTISLISSKSGSDSSKSNTLMLYLLDMIKKEFDKFESMEINIEKLELIFEILHNNSFVQEFRSFIMKCGFIVHLKLLESRKQYKYWGDSQVRAFHLALKFLSTITIFNDFQNYIVKNLSLVDNLIFLIPCKNENTSLLALQVVRNISANKESRSCLLQREELMQALSNEIRDSTNYEKLKASTVTIWMLVCNSTKGKSLAKKYSVHVHLAYTMSRMKNKEQIFENMDPLPEMETVLRIIM